MRHIGIVALPLSGDVPVYHSVPGGSVGYKPKTQDPNAGRMVHWNQMTNEMRYEDGTQFIPFKTSYVAHFVVTECMTIEEFIEKEYETVHARVLKRLTNFKMFPVSTLKVPPIYLLPAEEKRKLFDAKYRASLAQQHCQTGRASIITPEEFEEYVKIFVDHDVDAIFFPADHPNYPNMRCAQTMKDYLEYEAKVHGFETYEEFVTWKYNEGPWKSSGLLLYMDYTFGGKKYKSEKTND